jgi:hypothetical protein
LFVLLLETFAATDAFSQIQAMSSSGMFGSANNSSSGIVSEKTNTGNTSGTTVPQTSLPSVFQNPSQNPPDIVQQKEPYPVFIPYNKEGKTGSLYYIPEELYRLLMVSGHNSKTSGQWQIQKANYTGTLVRDPIQNEMVLSNLKAAYEIELVGHSASVRLPGMPILPDGARCDHRLIQPILNSAGNEYAFIMLGQGRHQLEISLVPTVYDEMSSRRFELIIPRVPDSTLELTYPTSAVSPIEVRYALGKVSHSSNSLKAELGPINKLAASWNTKQTASASDRLDAAQYFWMDVSSKQVRLYAQYRFRIAASSSAPQVQIAIDPRYQQDGDYRVIGGTAQINSITIQDNIATINFRNPVTENITLQQSYILKNVAGGGDFSGMGTVAAPRFSVNNARLDRSWLGVSSGNAIQIELPLSNIETKIFENTWKSFADVNENPKKPILHAYDLLRPQENWFLTIKNRPLSYRAEQRQWMFYRNKTIQMLIETEISPSYNHNTAAENPNTTPLSVVSRLSVSDAGLGLSTNENETADAEIPTFFYTFQTPNNFRYESVEVKNADGTITEKPRVEQQGEKLTLFFQKAVTNNFTVSLSGTIPSEQNREMLFPLITHDNQAAVNYSVYSYRDTSVLAEPKIPETSVRPVENTVNQTPAGFANGIFLSAFRITSLSDFSASQILLKPNKPHVVGKMISQLSRNVNSDHWDMSVDCGLDISQGELDQIMIFIPVNLDETLAEVIPKSDFSTTQTKKNNGTLIQVKPHKPLTGKKTFRLQFPVNGGLDSFTVPNLRFQTSGNIEKYLVLLRQFIGKRLDWSPINLAPIEPSDELFFQIGNEDEASRILTKNPEQYQYYRIDGDEFSATLNTMKQPSFVSCQDIAFFVRKNKVCFAVSTFDIQDYNSRNYCDVRIPENYQLVQIQLNDHFPTSESRGGNVYRIELPTDTQKQRLTIIICSNLFTTKEKTPNIVLPFPCLVDLPIQKTIWECYYEGATDTFSSSFSRFAATSDNKTEVVLRAVEKINSIDPAKNTNAPLEFYQKELTPLPLQNSVALQARVQLFRQNQLLTLLKNTQQTSGAGQEENPNRYRSWYSQWQETDRQIQQFENQLKQLPQTAVADAENHLWLSAFWRNSPPKAKPNDDMETELQELSTALSFANDCFSLKNVTQLHEETLRQYNTISGISALENESSFATVLTKNDNRDSIALQFMKEDSLLYYYIAGLGTHSIAELILTPQQPQKSLFQNKYFIASLWGAFCILPAFLLLHRRTAPMFRRFSVFFIIGLVVFCYFFARPNLIGWGILLILLLTVLRIQWNKMHITMTNLSRKEK